MQSEKEAGKTDDKAGKAGTEVTASRIGLATGAVGLASATAFMNISAWMGQGSTLSDKWINAAISGSLEVVGITALAWAGHQAGRSRPLRAGLAAIAGAGAIYFNTQASQGFFEAQDAAGANRIERAGASVETDAARIARLDAELAAIKDQNGGTLPRTATAIESAYGHLDPAKNPRTMARRNAELALRQEYDRLSDEIDTLREERSDDQVVANDAPRSVIPENQRLAFIWAVEAFKGAAFFLLGTGSIGRRRKARADDPMRIETASSLLLDHEALPDTLPPSLDRSGEAAEARETQSQRERRQGYAIARRKGWHPR